MTDPDRPPDADPRPWDQPGAVRRDREPDRSSPLQLFGLAAMGLGALGVLLLPAAPVGLCLGLVVHALARRDLARMRAGLMDPAGRPGTERAMKYATGGAWFGLSSLLVWGLFLAHILHRR
jgi:hypothetical protein